MKAPDFELQDQYGKTQKLADYKCKWLIVYFYPKDDTPGCTKEACSFRDSFDQFAEHEIAIIGISTDSILSHKKFAEKFHLNFPILSDLDHKVISAYGAWGKKKMMGREYYGTLRNSYLINPEGDIVKTYEKVDPSVHAEQILRDFAAINTAKLKLSF